MSSHIFVSAAHKSSGKTTVSIGLCRALRERGLHVQPFKKGPDYIDPLWLTQASERSCYNLDFYTMEPEEIDAEFARRMMDADIGIVEGNKGLYDGLDLDGSNSNAALAQRLGSPVVLVIDARGMTRGIAPLILGYQAFTPKVHIAGVILNHLGGTRHEAKLRAVIEHYTDVAVIGALQRNPELEIVERHLGLVPSNELRQVQGKIEVLGRYVAAHVDLDAVLALAYAAPSVATATPELQNQEPSHEIRIGVPRDAAFGFYYPGDLEALQAAGAKLVYFDTVHDQAVPAVDGLFIGGGFPETQMEGLEANLPMRQSLRAQIESGLPVYAECGGLMYLCRSIRWGERTCAMVGVLPADVRMHEKPQGRGYVRLRETPAAPWPKGESTQAGPIYAHEFHYSSLENLAEDLPFAYEVERGYGVNGRNDGIIYRNVLASYSHLRDVWANHWAARFTEFVRFVKARTSREARRVIP